MPGKKGIPGRKGIQGQPEMYDEHKKRVNISLTPTAVERLDALAGSMDVSRSELIEQVARGTIPLLTNSQAHRLGESSEKKLPLPVTKSTEEGKVNLEPAPNWPPNWLNKSLNGRHS